MNKKNTAVKVAKFAYRFAMDEVIGRITSALTATLMSGFVLPTIIFAVFSFVIGLGLGWVFWA